MLAAAALRRASTTCSQRIFQGQTIHERWYADYELRTVFTHDHHFPAVDQGRGLFGGLIVEPGGMDFRNSRTGVYHQPINDGWHGPVCGTSEGDAAGTTFEIGRAPRTTSVEPRPCLPGLRGR